MREAARFEVVMIQAAQCPNPSVAEKQSLEVVIGHAPSLPEVEGLAESRGLDALGPVPHGALTAPEARDEWFITRYEIGAQGYYVRETEEPLAKGSTHVGRIVFGQRENVALANPPDPPLRERPGYVDWDGIFGRR